MYIYYRLLLAARKCYKRNLSIINLSEEQQVKQTDFVNKIKKSARWSIEFKIHKNTFKSVYSNAYQSLITN